MRKSVLVIVDMQTEFSDAAKIVLKENLDAIRIAKQKNMFIVVLEFRGCGETIKPIQKSLEKYPLVTYKQKNMCGGSSHVREALKENNISPNRFFVTGVYSDACVHETVTGLAEKYSPIPVVVIDDAVADFCESGYEKSRRSKRNIKVQKGKVNKKTFVLST